MYGACFTPSFLSAEFNGKILSSSTAMKYTIHNPAEVNRVKTRGKNIHTLHLFPSMPGPPGPEPRAAGGAASLQRRCGRAGPALLAQQKEGRLWILRLAVIYSRPAGTRAASLRAAHLGVQHAAANKRFRAGGRRRSAGAPRSPAVSLHAAEPAPAHSGPRR